jgi:hypothetical protein
MPCELTLNHRCSVALRYVEGSHAAPLAKSTSAFEAERRNVFGQGRKKPWQVYFSPVGESPLGSRHLIFDGQTDAASRRNKKNHHHRIWKVKSGNTR